MIVEHFLCSENDRINSFKPSGEAYKDDAMTPVFSWHSKAFTSEELVAILLGSYEPEHTCICQPVNVSHNASFLVHVNSLEHRDDIKCDDMGSWRHNGTPKRRFLVIFDQQGIKKISATKDRDKSPLLSKTEKIYELKRAYYKNCSDESVRKIVSELHGTVVKHTLLINYCMHVVEQDVQKYRNQGQFCL